MLNISQKELNVKSEIGTKPTLDDFLSAFYPDPEEEICLRSFEPSGVPNKDLLPFGK
jgi:hypothetical protein